MRLPMNLNLTSLMTLFFVLIVLTGAIWAQDLSQQKQAKLKEISSIDTKLKGDLTKDEYDELILQREKLVSEVKSLDTKIKADVETMKKINAVKKAFNDGNNAYKLGQYAQAVEFYQKATSQDSTFYRAYYGEGLARMKTRKYSEAITAYQGAIRHNPAYVDAYIALGKIYSALSQPDNAIYTYKQGIQNDPTSSKLYYELGAEYLNRKKDYNNAFQNFTKATQLDPEYDLAFYSLGVSLSELSRFEEAVLALENALAVTNRRSWEAPHYRLAVVYNKQGNYAEAKKSALESLKAKSNYAPASYEAGKACKDLKQYQEAIAHFQKAAADKVWKRAAEYEIDLIQNRDKYGLE